MTMPLGEAGGGGGARVQGGCLLREEAARGIGVQGWPWASHQRMHRNEMAPIKVGGGGLNHITSWHEALV
ncbi:hypothetical protein ACRRTK_008516 [Alexandromys fortis]